MRENVGGSQHKHDGDSTRPASRKLGLWTSFGADDSKVCSFVNTLARNAFLFHASRTILGRRFSSDEFSEKCRELAFETKLESSLVATRQLH